MPPALCAAPERLVAARARPSSLPRATARAAVLGGPAPSFNTLPLWLLPRRRIVTPRTDAAPSRGRAALRCAAAAAAPLWTEPAAAVPNSAAIGYAFLGHTAAAVVLALPATPLPLRLAAVLLAAHTLVIHAYLVHDAAHNTLFAAPRNNSALGAASLWCCGAAYASFARVQHMHVRHHRDRQDTGVVFSHVAFLKALPRLLRTLVFALEWAYIPAVELVMGLQIAVRPFVRPAEAHRRARVLAVAASRLGLYAALWAAGGGAAVLSYAAAFLLFKQAMHFNDTFHHTFDQTIIQTEDEVLDMAGKTYAYEDANTLSNVISTRWPWLNALVLNNGYHNAHHHRTSVPWWKLPAHHAAIYLDDADTRPCMIPYAQLLRSFHTHRVARLMVEDYGQFGPPGSRDRAMSFIGAHGVSFLTVC